MAGEQVTGFKQIFADKKLQKAYEKTCYMNKDYEINTAAEREKLNTLFGENGKYRASMTDDQISMMDSFIGTTPKKEVKTQEDGSITVYNNGEKSSATIISGDNNTVVNGNVTNNNGQVAIGHDNEQNMGMQQETLPVLVKKEIKNEKSVKEKAPVKKTSDKKDKPVEKSRGNDIKPRDEISAERLGANEKLDLTGTYFDDSGKMRSRDGKIYNYGFYINLQPGPNVQKDLNYIKQTVNKNLSQIRGYKTIVDQLNSMNSKEEIQACLKSHGIELKFVY